MKRTMFSALSLVAVSGIALAGCASSGDESGAASNGDDAISIVASTSVYADLAQKVVGDAAEVTAIIDSPTVDPHDYEATAKDQLAVTEADLAIFNGGGYDYYMEQLVDSGDVKDSVMAVEFSHDYPGAEGEEGHDHEEEGAEHDHDHAEDEEHEDEDSDGHEHHHIHGFNEHVWYDPHTMIHVVEAIAEKSAELLPDDADAIEENSAALIGQLEGLESDLEAIKAEHEGETVAFTEPVGAYFTADAGLEDVTAEGFAEAVEEGQDVPPATLLKATTALEDGDVDVLVLNPQTAGPATDSVQKAAAEGGVPIVEFTETIPEGEDYVSWMQANADALSEALDG